MTETYYCPFQDKPIDVPREGTQLRHKAYGAGVIKEVRLTGGSFGCVVYVDFGERLVPLCWGITTHKNLVEIED